jgi:hypothetical protein
MGNRSGGSLQRLAPGQSGGQSPTGPALHGQSPVNDEGRKDQGVSLAESDPVAGSLAIEDLDSTTVISAGSQLKLLYRPENLPVRSAAAL